MRAWAWAAMFVSLGAVWACGGGGETGASSTTGTHGTSTGTGGSGGTGGTGGTGATGSTGGSTSSSGTGGNKNCTLEPDHAACVACEADKNPNGAALYDALNECIFCSECYNACDGASLGCASAPPQKGACDADAPDPAACGDTNGGCVKCAYAGACGPAAGACVASQDCIDYGASINNCPP